MSEQAFDTGLRPSEDTFLPRRAAPPATGHRAEALTPSTVAELARLHEESERISAQADRPLAFPTARRDLKATLQAELDALHSAGFSSFAEFSSAMHAVDSVEEPATSSHQAEEPSPSSQVLRDAAEQVRESLATTGTDTEAQDAALTQATLESEALRARVTELEATQAEVAQLHTELTQRQDEMTALRTELTRRQDEISDLRTEVSRRAELEHDAVTDAAGARTELTTTLAEIDQLNARITELTTEVTRDETEVHTGADQPTLEAKLAVLEIDIERVRVKRRRYKAEVREARHRLREHREAAEYEVQLAREAATCVLRAAELDAAAVRQDADDESTAVRAAASEHACALVADAEADAQRRVEHADAHVEAANDLLDELRSRIEAIAQEAAALPEAARSMLHRLAGEGNHS